ncbi:hypothetical protein CTAYLR_009823 [Chrysophaeum taylorii]|uniref:Protein-tyrosine sulfotransferase n=1 Tax=Chrysophaeum taylorii TaxID=2483200 RepID=A0AAD7XKM7_9STRA|nr:hypothetical protein CTAYLR_009823 [Chrysophaeum taylorii]
MDGEAHPLPVWARVALLIGQFVFLYAVRWVILRLTRPAHLVPPRVSPLLRLINWSLWIPCRLAEMGYEVPRVGYMLGRELSLPKLMRIAEKRTGLSDWGETKTFPSLYETVVRRLNEVNTSPFGRLITFDNLMRRLMVRLQVVDAAKKRGGIKVRAPIFVMGLPRTGTTFLHRLLALDPAARYPETHELLQPLSTYPREKRVKYWESKLAQLKAVIPHIEVIHEIGAEEPEECHLGLSVEVPMLPTTYRHLIRHVVEDAPNIRLPSFESAYELYKRQLELLAEDPSRRWVLKCPLHVGFVEDLLTVFPDATLVWTHRDPARSLPSLGSLFRTFADMCEQRPTNLRAIGAEQLVFWSAAIHRATKALKHNPGKCAHVAYDDLVADPLATVERLYAAIGLAVSDEFRDRIRAYLDRNNAQREQIPRHLRKFHAYSLQEYGLTSDKLRAEMPDYYATYVDAPPVGSKGIKSPFV